jgi:hypothetical protein
VTIRVHSTVVSRPALITTLVLGAIDCGDDESLAGVGSTTGSTSGETTTTDPTCASTPGPTRTFSLGYAQGEGWIVDAAMGPWRGDDVGL